MLSRRPVEPVFRWAGGKRWLIPIFERVINAARPGGYFEPFLGGGAIALAFTWQRSTLGDTNADLIAAYRGIRADPAAVRAKLRRMPVTRSEYERVRSVKVRCDTSAAARLLYLNRCGYGGIYRTDVHGRYNVPFSGDRSTTRLWQTDRLNQVASALELSHLVSGDFEETVKGVSAGDLVYFDPAYVLPEVDVPFSRYSSPRFTWADQKRLSDTAHDLAQRGAVVITSNADDPRIEALFTGGFSLHLKRRSPFPRANGAEVREALYLLAEPGTLKSLRKSLEGA